MKLTRFLAKKVVFLICLGKELAGISSALSMQKNGAIQHQSNRKRTTATENQQPRQRKPDSIFVKEAKIENAAPVIRIFARYLHGLLSPMG